MHQLNLEKNTSKLIWSWRYWNLKCPECKKFFLELNIYLPVVSVFPSLHRFITIFQFFLIQEMMEKSRWCYLEWYKLNIFQRFFASCHQKQTSDYLRYVNECVGVSWFVDVTITQTRVSSRRLIVYPLPGRVADALFMTSSARGSQSCQLACVLQTANVEYSR